MTDEQGRIHFAGREFRGSRFRCLLATHEAKREVVAFLNSLVQPLATVGENDRYMPEGLCKPDEARLNDTNGFLVDDQRRIVAEWWLAAPQDQSANTPNWDIVGSCTVHGREGLILVEAKAHASELNPKDRCGASDKGNRGRIATAIGDANKGLGEGWALSVDSHYQLGNRFAWAWKLASLGIPVVLIYLGFLNAHEMDDPFTSHKGWEDCVLRYAEGTVPRRVWNSESIKVNGIPVIPLIRSAEVNVKID
jgi:hypothetical protein